MSCISCGAVALRCELYEQRIKGGRYGGRYGNGERTGREGTVVKGRAKCGERSESERGRDSDSNECEHKQGDDV